MKQSSERTKKVTVFLTEEELGRAKDTADWFGLSVSPMCRMVLSLLGSDEETREFIRRKVLQRLGE